MALNFLFESTAIAELIYKVVIIGCLEYLNESNNMSSILNFRERLYFVDSKLLQFWTHFKFLHSNDFDGYYLVGLLVDCFVHLAKLSLPDDII